MGIKMGDQFVRRGTKRKDVETIKNNYIKRFNKLSKIYLDFLVF